MAKGDEKGIQRLEKIRMHRKYWEREDIDLSPSTDIMRFAFSLSADVISQRRSDYVMLS